MVRKTIKNLVKAWIDSDLILNIKKKIIMKLLGS